MKKKKKGSPIYWVLLLVCVGVFAFSFMKAGGEIKTYWDADQEYKDLAKKNKKHKKNKKMKVPLEVDFDSLKKENPDVVGWLYIPDSSIDYPIVQTDNNSYYLNHTFSKEENHCGALFLDMYCNPDFSSDNSIVYGHNLKNQKMFGTLKLMYDKTYSKDASISGHPYIWVITPDENICYKVFAARRIEADKDEAVYTYSFADQNAYDKYVKNCISCSQYKSPVKNPEGRLITLSTCTSDTEQGRFVVQGVEVPSE